MNTTVLLILTVFLIICFIIWIFQINKMKEDTWERIFVGISYKKESFNNIDRVLTVANATTFLGIIASSWLLIDAIWFQAILWWQALYLLCLTLSSDGLDGFFARSLKECSVIGQIIDPFRDREAALAIIVLLLQSTQPIVTLLAIGVLLAEGVIVILAYNANQKKRPLSVHTIGKFRMGIHIACGMVFIAFPETALFAATGMLFASISSLMAYVVSYWKLANPPLSIDT